jgi:SET domain-containing protein
LGNLDPLLGAALLIEIKHSLGRGRGVFAATAIPKDSIIETSAVLMLDAREQELIAQTQVDDYLFSWDDPEAPQHDQAMVLGRLSMANHSEQPNTVVRRHYAERLMEWVAMRDIAAGEELTFRYRCELWFQPA